MEDDVSIILAFMDQGITLALMNTNLNSEFNLKS